MECRVRSSTKVTTKWYKETTIIRESVRCKSSVISESKEEYTIRLDIEVNIEDFQSHFSLTLGPK